MIEDGVWRKFWWKQDYIMIRVKTRNIVLGDKNPAASTILMPIITRCLSILEREILIHFEHLSDKETIEVRQG